MAENNRVLTHSEFAAKYNHQSEQDIASSYSEISNASDNFQEGFDDSTYEEGQTGPKRPLSQGAEETPDAPNRMPTEPTKGMAAPTDTEEEDHITPEEMENEDDDTEESEAEDFEGEEYGDPEEDEEEDEDEETNESMQIAKKSSLLESFDDFEARGQIPMLGQPYADRLDTIELDFGEEEEGEENDCFVTCKSCGAKKEIEKGSYPMGAANQADPGSWWQGANIGMKCEECQ